MVLQSFQSSRSLLRSRGEMRGGCSRDLYATKQRISAIRALLRTSPFWLDTLRHDSSPRSGSYTQLRLKLGRRIRLGFGIESQLLADCDVYCSA